MPVVPRFKQGRQELDDFKLEFLRSGGLADEYAVPEGYSPESTNMVSMPGRTATRWGLTSVATFASAVVSMKEFVAQDADTRRLLVLLANGTLQHDAGSYAFVTIQASVVQASAAAALKMNSTTAFGREYMAFSTNGVTAAQVPCAWDGTDFRRVAPEGPGLPPLLADGAAGNVSAGVHKLRVLFRTKWGFLTPPSPFRSHAAAGGTVLDITGIPIGPSYVVGRVLAFTAADDEDYYFVAGSAMDIENNTATTATVDFTDTELLAGTPVAVQGSPDSDLATLINLPGQSACFRYKERLVWVGERSNLVRNGDIGPVAMGFDTGFTGGLPNGWSTKVTGYSDGGAGVTGEFGGVLAITGNGATQQGVIENQALDLSWIPPGVDIRWRARVRRNATLAAGTLHLTLVTATGAAGTATVEPDTGSTRITQSEVSDTEWRIIDKLFVSAANNTKTNLYKFRLAGGGSGLGTVMTNNGIYYIDYLELYVASMPNQPSLARISRASQPDAYDGLTGYQYVAQDNGQRLVTGFQLGDVLYYVKERSLHATRDDGSGEPAFWPPSIVSDRVGSPSPQGVGRGDQWVAIAGRDGLYYFDGGEPVLLSEPAGYYWDQIDWSTGHEIVCRVDMQRKCILVAKGLTVFYFHWIGQSPLGQVLRFNRHFCQPGGAGTAVRAMATSYRSDGTEHFLYAIDSGSRIARIDESTHSDFGNAISYRYETNFFGDMEGAKTFDKMRAYMYGQGTVRMRFARPNGGSGDLDIDYVLTSGPRQDLEWPEIRVPHTRTRVTFDPVSLVDGDYIILTRLVLYWHQDEERGTIERGT